VRVFGEDHFASRAVEAATQFADEIGEQLVASSVHLLAKGYIVCQDDGSVVKVHHIEEAVLVVFVVGEYVQLVTQSGSYDVLAGVTPEKVYILTVLLGTLELQLLAHLLHLLHLFVDEHRDLTLQHAVSLLYESVVCRGVYATLAGCVALLDVIL